MRAGGGTAPAKQVSFVAGVQRSGTNMMMDVLERSLVTDVYHEHDSRAFDGYELRSPEVIRKLIERSPAGHVVIKALCELQDLSQLLEYFAPAKAVWVLRDYADTVNSHIALWNKMPYFVGETVKSRQGAAGWRGRGMSDATHELVSRLYTSDISNASACALFWYFRNVLFFEQGFDRDERVLLVRYDSLVTNPREQFESTFRFLGLPYSPWVHRKVVSSSVRKRPAPDLTAEIEAVCRDLARRFEAI